MKMKKLLAMAAASLMALTGLASCGGSESSSKSGDASKAETQGDTTTQAADESKPGDESQSGGELYVSKHSTQEEIRDISSWELMKEVKYGWNLGNTMDATGSNGLNNEVSWQSERTHKGMFDLLVQDGFNLARIPVT